MPRSTFAARRLYDGGVMAVDARSGRVFCRHSHDEFGIGLITGGAQRSWSGRGHVEAGPGHLITVNPGEVHDGAPIGTERAWSMLYFTPGVIRCLATDLSEGKVPMPELKAPVVDDARLSRSFLAARAAASGEPAAFEAHALVLLAGLLEPRPQSPPPGPDPLARVRQKIDDEPTARHSLGDLAAVAGLSRFQLLRGFTQMTGLPPHAYVVQRRLDLARHLIRGGSGLVEAALAAGFADQSHFHRSFLTRYGLTPGAYAAAVAT